MGADWKNENWKEDCDPRVKWAMEVMDQEGAEFTGVLGRSAAPLFAGLLPLQSTVLVNWIKRVPLRTNMFWAICASPVFAFAGIQYKNWNFRRAAEEEAMVRHYILTHPERFSEPKKVKYLDHIESWKPIRF